MLCGFWRTCCARRQRGRRPVFRRPSLIWRPTRGIPARKPRHRCVTRTTPRVGEELAPLRCGPRPMPAHAAPQAQAWRSRVASFAPIFPADLQIVRQRRGSIHPYSALLCRAVLASWPPRTPCMHAGCSHPSPGRCPVSSMTGGGGVRLPSLSIYGFPWRRAVFGAAEGARPPEDSNAARSLAWTLIHIHRSRAPHVAFFADSLEFEA